MIKLWDENGNDTEIKTGLEPIVENIRRLRINDLHDAARRLDWLESSDNVDLTALRSARFDFNKACNACVEAGINVDDELRGKNYLL
jgi:hypothetical protein